MNTKTVYIPRIPEHDAYDGIYVVVCVALAYVVIPYCFARAVEQLTGR